MLQKIVHQITARPLALEKMRCIPVYLSNEWHILVVSLFVI